MITITTPVEVAPTLVRAFGSEGVRRERTNQLVLNCGGHDDGDHEQVGYNEYEHLDTGYFLPV